MLCATNLCVNNFTGILHSSGKLLINGYFLVKKAIKKQYKLSCKSGHMDSIFKTRQINCNDKELEVK